MKRQVQTSLKAPLTRRMFWFDKADDEALMTIMQLYRCQTKVQAVRLALSLTATSNPSPKAAPQPRKRRVTKPAQHALTALAEMATQTPLLGLPADFAERLDDYLYGEMRAGL